MTRAGGSLHVPVILFAILVFCVALLFNLGEISIPKFALFAYGTLWGIYTFHVLSLPIETWTLIRIPIFVVSSFLFLFVVPNFIDFDDFLLIIYLLTTALSIIGLPTLILGEYQLLGLVVKTHNVTKALPLFSTPIYPLKSLLANPNPFGFVTGIGFVSGLSLYYRDRRFGHIPILIVLFAGVLLSASRGALLTTLVGVGVLSAYTCLGLKVVYAAIISGLASVVYSLAALIGFVPDIIGIPGLIPRRIELWMIGIQAISDYLLFGTGFLPLGDVLTPYVPQQESVNNLHNTYLYVLLTRGFVGGIVHFGFLGLLYRNCLSKLRDVRSATALALLTMVLIEMLFEGMAMFGLSLFSVLPALVFGYALYESTPSA